MTCQRCNSDRILRISAKCSDLCFSKYKELEKDGYTPDLPFTEYGDYLSPTICMECGQVQGKFPVTDAQIRKGWN